MKKKYKSQDELIRDALKEAYGASTPFWTSVGWLIQDRAVYGIEKVSGFGSRPYLLFHTAIFNGGRFQRIPKDPFNKMLKDEDDLRRHKETVAPQVNVWIRDRIGV